MNSQIHTIFSYSSELHIPRTQAGFKDEAWLGYAAASQSTGSSKGRAALLQSHPVLH